MPTQSDTYRELESRWKALRATHDVAVREVACVNAPRTLLCVETGGHELPRIALSAGVHGDEPAGPWALLSLVEDRLLNADFAYRIWPCMNPTGMTAATRESADGVDINRTFGRGGGSPEARAIVTANRDLKFALSIDLHEDCDAAGFYCYEYGGGAFGLAALAAVEARGFSIDPLDELDFGTPLVRAVLQCERGRVTADPFQEASAYEGLSYSLLIARNAARHALTFETPSRRPYADRLAMHQVAVRAAVDALSQAIGK